MTDPAERADPAPPETPPPPVAPTRPEAPRDEPATPGPGNVAPWAPPGAAPFGAPAGPPAPHGGQGARGAVYAPPAGYAPPPAYAPGPVVASPPGAASGHPPAAVANAGARRAGALGVVALVLALLAAVGASVLAAFASFQIGLGTGREIAMRALDADFDWSILTPVRDWVLLGEISFWAGTVLGIAALVLGIIAIVTRRGRGAGIAAVVIAVLGPVAFGVVVQGFLTAGFTAGSSVGG